MPITNTKHWEYPPLSIIDSLKPNYNNSMSDLGEAGAMIGGEVLGAFIGIPLGIITLCALPFMAIDSCNQHFAKKKAKVEQAAKVYNVIQNPKEAVKHPILTYKFVKGEKEPVVNTTKESLSFRAGQAVKQSSKDFVRGIFTKSPNENHQ